MATTYEPIQTTTLTSAQSSITFSSIPSTYTDLRLVVMYRSNAAGTSSSYALLRFNGDTGNNYSLTVLQGDGTSATSATASNSNNIRVVRDSVSLGTSSGWVFSTMDLFSYSGSTYKTLLINNSVDANGSGRVQRTVALWRSTSAIDTILLDTSGSGGEFVVGTTATLFGIKASA